MTITLDDFIKRWHNANGSERANYQLFLTELCALLDLGRPDPASEDTENNAYVFERKVTFRHADGSSTNGFIDLYRRGSFVCEAKQTNKELDSKGWDNAMLRAHAQAQQYARALPAAEGRPPFLILVDVGRNIELYAEFTRSGATHVPYPDPRSHRLCLEDLRKPEVQDTLPYPDKPAAQAEAEEELLARLVALNAERAAEEARGLVRWLRPEFQAAGVAQPAQGEMDTGEETEIATTPAQKHAWPKTIPEQVQALRAALATAPAPQTSDQLARTFARADEEGRRTAGNPRRARPGAAGWTTLCGGVNVFEDRCLHRAVPVGWAVHSEPQHWCQAVGVRRKTPHPNLRYGRAMM